MSTDPEWLERLRQSGLRLDCEGRWWHEGQLVEHPGLTHALHRWLDREDGRYVVRWGEEYAYVEVEDAPFLVRTLRLDQGRIWLALSDDSEQELDYDSLTVGRDNALYCRVRQGRFDARFGWQAQQILAQWLDEDAELGFVLRAGGGLWPIRPRPPSGDLGRHPS